MKRWSRGTLPLAIVIVTVGAACGGGTSADSTDETEAVVVTSTTLPGTSDVSETSPSSGGEQPVTDPSTQPASPPAEQSYDGTNYPESLAAAVGAAVNDLAERLAVEPGSIVVGVVEEVTWPNAGLGCPEPDMQYAQVMVDGLRIVLIHDGIEYRYHSGGSVEPFLCLSAPSKDTRGVIVVPSGSADESTRTTDGIFKPVTPEVPKDSTPTDQAGGPGGQPND